MEESREAQLLASNESLTASLQHKMQSMSVLAQEMDLMRQELSASKEVRERLKQELAESQRCISELQAENTRLHVDSGTMGLLVQPHASLNELRWRQGESAPVMMTRGSICSHNNKVYFNPCFSNTVYGYTLTEGTTRPPMTGSSELSGDTHIQGRKAEHKDSAPCSDNTTADNTGETTASYQTQMNGERKEKPTTKRATSEGPPSDAAENTPTGAWSILPACPYLHFSLAVVRGALTTIGGARSNMHKTGSLLSLSCPGQQWVERLPCMPTERSYTTAATSGKLLVVVGGEGQGAKKLGTVEVMNIHTEQWQSAAWLPVAVTLASSTVCGGQIYIGGGFDKNTHEDCSVYTCSLARLVTEPARKRKSLSLGQRAEHGVWRAIQDVPLAGAALVSVCGQLLAVGGKTRASGASSTLVHRYDVHEAVWEVHGSMSTARCLCVAASPQPDTVVVAGGAFTCTALDIASTHDCTLTL